MKQIETQVGILNGIILNLVNLQNMEKVNIMVGIVIVGNTLMRRRDQVKEKLGNCLLQLVYQIIMNTKEDS